MAILFMDGFDHYATADILKKPYSSLQGAVSGGSPVTIAAVGRNSTNGLYLQALPSGLSNVRGYLIKSFPGLSVTAGGCGFAFQHSSLAQDTEDGRELVRVMEASGSVAHLTVKTNQTSGTLSVRRNTTTLGTTTEAVTAGVYYYLEFKWSIHDSTGSYELRLNGTTVLSGSSVDTRNGGSGIWDTIMLSSIGTGTGVSTSFDDFVVWDTTGSAPYNDFLGPVRVKTIFPDGAGASSDFTPSAGSNYQNVDEASQDGDTTYNSESTPGDHDTYTFGAVGLTGTVLGVQTNLWVRSDGAGSETIRPKIRIGATDYNGTTVGVSTDYANKPEVFQVSPATSTAWTVTEIDGAEFGIELVS